MATLTLGAPRTRQCRAETRHCPDDHIHDANTFGGDPQDWDASNPSDPYNAFTGTNQGHAITSYDITTLDVIGYDLRQAAVPEPGTLALLGTSLLGRAVLRRLRRRRT
jgi:hypothetical protein